MQQSPSNGPTETINGRLEHLCGSALGFRNLTNYIARSSRPEDSDRNYTLVCGEPGKVYCSAVLDTYSRRVVDWSIDASPTAAPVTNALGMAIDSRPGSTSTPGP